MRRLMQFQAVECRNSGILVFRNSGVPEFRNSGTPKQFSKWRRRMKASKRSLPQLDFHLFNRWKFKRFFSFPYSSYFYSFSPFYYISGFFFSYCPWQGSDNAFRNPKNFPPTPLPLPQKKRILKYIWLWISKNLCKCSQFFIKFSGDPLMKHSIWKIKYHS